jgi:tetratricopeptide (TPR) repeat protein
MRAVLALLVLMLACSGAEERREVAREQFEAAMASGDAAAALGALDDLRDGLPGTPEATFELVRLLIRAGKTNRARWLLEEEALRHPERADVQLALAETALLVGDAARALAAVDHVPADDPQHARALLLRSRAELDLGDLEAGLVTLERGEELYPDRFELRVARIETLVTEERFASALELVRQARLRDDLDDSERAWLERSEARLLQAQGDTDGALDLLEAMTAANPGDAQAWESRAAILIEAGRADEACDALARALEAHPDAWALYGLLASAQLARGDGEAAEAALRERVERAPDASSTAELAVFLHRTGRSAEGAAVLEDAVAGGHLGLGSVELEYIHVAMLLSAGDTAAAQQRFEEFERRHPSDARTEYLRARFELARGDARAAAERLKQVLPQLDRSDVQHWLAVALEVLGDNEGAEYRYGLAIQRSPDQISSYPGLIRALERRGAWAAAGQYALALLKRAPNTAVAFEALTRSLLMRGAPEEAEKVLREFVGRYPELPAPTIALSEVVRSQGRPEDSLALLDEAAARFEGEPEWAAERAIVLGLLSRGDEGLAVLQRASAEGDHASLHRARAFLLFTAGKGSEGLAEVERALALDPTNPLPLRMSGDYLSSRGDFAAAVGAYERYLELQPGDAEVAFRLGVARGRSGDATGAIAAYRKAVALDAQAVAPRNNLALMLEEQGQLKEALEVAQAAFAHAESNPVVMDTLGWLYLRAGRVDRAVALLEKARRIDPEAAHLRYHLALAYREAGRTGEARELLNELHESLDTGHELFARVDEATASLP